jgi:kumamolisin
MHVDHGSAARLPHARRLGVAALVCSALLAAAALAGTVPFAASPARAAVVGVIPGSRDLGPSMAGRLPVVLALRSAQRPTALAAWARRCGLTVSWRPGQRWAIVSGSAGRIGAALAVRIDDFRSPDGQRYYAALSAPAVPATLTAEVAQVSRPDDVPWRRAMAPVTRSAPGFTLIGLNPEQLLNVYSAANLAGSGYTGRGMTVVFYEWTGVNQVDLDAYTRITGLPPLHPVLVGDPPTDASVAPIMTEATMDVEVTHAIAPDARIVIVNANDAETGPAIAAMFTRTEQAYPGSVWSLSIGWRQCAADWTAAELAPVESALEQAEKHGTTAFDASGDTGGLECKGSADYGAPPTARDVGVDGVGSVPAMTSVGGTYVSNDASGRWLGEEAWDWSVLSQGSAGGVATQWPRPSWQDASGVSAARDRTHRLVPDVSADADPASGATFVVNGYDEAGGGTSQAAPIWAGLTVLMDQYVTSHGGRLVGAINPLLYKIARGAALPAFHDVVAGGNAVDLAAPGYDLVTGLGTPVTDNLARDLLAAEKGTS